MRVSVRCWFPETVPENAPAAPVALSRGNLPLQSQQPLAAASWPLWARPMRHFGLLLAILGICVACAEATAACNSYQSIKVLLGRASLPAVARERGKTSAAGRRAWQVRSSWPHHGRCKRA